MVRTKNMRMNSDIMYPWNQRPWVEEIIDSPTGIISSGISEIRPPSIGSDNFGIPFSEYINHADIQELFESWSFLLGKSVFSFILFGMFEVYGHVCDIEVSAEDDRLMGLQFCHKISHGFIPFLAITEAWEVILGIWNIGRDIVEILEFQS